MFAVSVFGFLNPVNPCLCICCIKIDLNGVCVVLVVREWSVWLCYVCIVFAFVFLLCQFKWLLRCRSFCC